MNKKTVYYYLALISSFILANILLIMKLGMPMSGWEFFARLSPAIITMVLLPNKKKFTGTDWFFKKQYDCASPSANPANRKESLSSLPDISEKEKQGYLGLLKLCCSDKTQKSLTPFFKELNNHRDNKAKTTLHYVVDYLGHNNHYFINKADWKISFYGEFEWFIKKILEKNYPAVDIDSIPYEKNTSITDNMFKSVDKYLRQHQLQLGFIDWQYDEYLILIHNVPDRDKVERFVNMIGYPYFEKREIIIPDFLNDFKHQLEKSKLDSVKIQAKIIREGEESPLTHSKFLGTPYWPMGMAYPKDTNGKPMILLAQINFSEMPNIPNYPTNGILQFFASSTQWMDMKDYKVYYHDNIEKEYQTDFSFLTEALYKYSPIWREHKLHFEKSVDYGGYEDFRFDIDFNGQHYLDFQEDYLTTEQIKKMDNLMDGTGHKIGGYASFTQYDPREYDPKLKNDVQLLQIDIDDEIMFGDAGLAHLFINETSLKAKDFSKAWFYWDCC